METKQQIRKQIRTLRRQMLPEEVEQKSRQITEQVLSTKEFEQASLILVYADFQNEVQTRSIVEAGWKSGKTVGFPKVNGKEMDFYIVTDWTQLAPGAMNILEPTVSCEKITSFPKETLMIMPGVAFDRSLHRVGYGGGYYDRFLCAHPSLHVIAIGYELQLCTSVPTEPTDYKPDILVTEKQILTGKN